MQAGLLDLLKCPITPQYRYEIPADLAKLWLQRRRYKEIKITATDQFGFSIAADKE